MKNLGGRGGREKNYSVHFFKNNEYETVCEGVFMIYISVAECLCENKQCKEKKTLNLLWTVVVSKLKEFLSLASGKG